jgi:quinol-cytochrome oxidoreductase complex cytochrome b subunit
MAFDSTERIMRDVNYGWLIRYLHSNGASFFFIVVYLHMLRSMYFGSYKYPRELNWILGVFIFLLMIATSFLGYTLPWGQMSYWGATVITNLFSAIPIVGEGIQIWLLGDYNVGNATLNRFFALHYVLPFVIFGVVALHVAAVHVHGSNNPDGIEIKSKGDSVNFFPYMIIKDLVAFCAFGVLISAVIFFGPNLMAEVDNYIPANPMVTPSHIVPNWYLAPFYAILRAIPDKLMGVAMMGGAIAILFVLPWLDTSKVRSCKYRPIYKWFMMAFFVNFFALGYVGMMPAEGLYLLIAQLGTVYYFGFIMILTPFIGWIEKSDKMPLSISDVYSGQIKT